MNEATTIDWLNSPAASPDAGARDGAAICAAARTLGAPLEVINLGTAHDTGPLDGVKDCHLGPGTANFTLEPAMDVHQLGRALGVGRHAAERARLNGAQLFIGGEMGIGNTTAATALACALHNEMATFAEAGVSEKNR